MWKYCKLVIYTAAISIIEYAGPHWFLSAFISIVSWLLLIPAVHWYRLGWAAAYEEAQVGMSSLYALFIFVPFLFLGFLIYAPFRLFKEQEQARQEHLGELEKVKQELRELKTPKVSLSIYTIDKETDEYKVETIVLKAMSHSIGPISVTLKAVDIQNIECVQFAPTIHISPDGTEAIKLDKDEHKHFIAVSYNPTSNSLRVNVPFETHAPQVAKGNEFFITIKAFGPTEPATIRFHFGVEDGWLWYREEGSTEKISYKTLMEKAWPLP